MTNKKFRDDLAKEMRDKYNERNKQLEQIEKLPLKESKELARRDIMDNFNQEMEEMKSRPGYAEARQTHLKEIKTKIKLSKSKGEKEKVQREYEGRLAEIDASRERLQREYEERLAEIDANRETIQKEYEKRLVEVDTNKENIQKEYENAQIAHRGKVEQNITYDKAATENLRGNREAILKDLREHHVKVEEASSGKKVHINLPAVGSFSGFKFDFYISNDKIGKKDFQEGPYGRNSFSIDEVDQLLCRIKTYMGEMGVEIDKEFYQDYFDVLRNKTDGNDRKYRGYRHECDAGDCLAEVLPLDGRFWLSDIDKDSPSFVKPHASWVCYKGGCYFEWVKPYRIGDPESKNDEFGCYLFMKI